MSDFGKLSNGEPKDNLVIWDTQAPYPVGAGWLVLWRRFALTEAPNIVSIPMLIEESADALKAQYLALVYELGEMRFKGKRLVDHLQLRPSFSYWWMTLLVEKCNFAKTPQIDDAIRMLALVDWIAGRSIKLITLVSANKLLAESLRGWCEKKGVAFEWQQLPKLVMQRSMLVRAFAALPLVIQAWMWLLKHLLERWSLRGVGLRTWRQTTGQITFVTYSDNCVSEALQKGRYESRYWAHLPDTLKQEGMPTNWLHLYVKDDLLPTAKHAASALNAFNKSANGLQCHVTLDAFIGLGVILRTVRDWLYLIGKGVIMRGDLRPAPFSSIDLWPFLRADWQRSIFGVDAMSNVLYLNLFEAALKILPKQLRGVYLQENMGWEFGFVHAWRAAEHGRLIGTPHSTVRFWDLRYFFDSRSYLRAGNNDLPLPDCVGCNGPAMRATYQQGGYLEESLVDVEALRYLHVGQRQGAIDSVPKRKNEPVRLLILGDYLHSHTQFQMKLLEQAVSLMPQPMLITVKPHPNCQVVPGDYPALQMQISMEPIAKLLAECDVAYASAVTSAAVDAFCAGVPIISVLDPNTLNLSPLRSCTGVLFASTASALAIALISAANNAGSSINQPAYFTVNPLLSNWRRLLL